MHTRFAYHAISVTGRRPANEDAWSVHRYGETLFCAVADGIGGRPAGEVAASLAVQTAEEVVTRGFWTALSGETGQKEKGEGEGERGQRDETGTDIPALLREAHLAADTTVKTAATGRNQGMGTTLTTAIFTEGCLITCNSGDSRCSLVRDGKLIPVTRDHSFVQEQVDAGIIHPDDAFAHPKKHIITHSIGGSFAADVQEVPLTPGDTIILSTDGMHDYITPDAIVRAVQGRTAEDAAAALLSEAAVTSWDNITICVVTVSEN